MKTNDEEHPDINELRALWCEEKSKSMTFHAEVERLRAEVAALKAEVSRISLRWEIADHRVSLLWAERDEARRELCQAVAFGNGDGARDEAAYRGWDCFEEAKP
jgi:hypothetical protein